MGDPSRLTKDSRGVGIVIPFLKFSKLYDASIHSLYTIKLF